MKVCFRCKVLKSNDEFNRSPKNRDGLHSYCRECQKAHYRDNYERHLANVRKTSLARIAKMREVVFDAMKSGCVDCGNVDIRVLEFDHVRGIKKRSISDLVRRGAGIDALRDELAKCEVRCRNCHAIATFSRLGGSWHDQFL
jgi:hypothetical protein